MPPPPAPQRDVPGPDGWGAPLLHAPSAAATSGAVSAASDGYPSAARSPRAAEAAAGGATADGRNTADDNNLNADEEEAGGTHELAFALESYARAAAAAAAAAEGAITPTAQEMGGNRSRRRLPTDDPDAPYIFTPPGVTAEAKEEEKDGRGEQTPQRGAAARSAPPPPSSARPVPFHGAPPPLRMPQQVQPADDPFSSSAAAIQGHTSHHVSSAAVAAALARRRLPHHHSPSEALRSVNRLIAWPAGTVAPLSPRCDGKATAASRGGGGGGEGGGSMPDADDDSGAFLMSPLGTPEVQPLPPLLPQAASAAAAAPSSWGGWGSSSGGSSSGGGGGGNPYSMLPATRASSWGAPEEPAPPLFGPGAGVKHSSIDADYELGRQIGDGGFAVVRLAVVKEGGDGAAAARGHPLVVKVRGCCLASCDGCSPPPTALSCAPPPAAAAAAAVQCVRKQYLVSPEERDSAVREVEIHRSLSGHHARVVPLFDAYEDAAHVYLVMEAAAGGDLASYVRTKCVRQFSEIQVRRRRMVW